MKKVIFGLIVLGLIACTATFMMADITVRAEGGYMTDYAFRGQELANDVYIANVQTEINNVYVGVNSYWADGDKNFNNQIQLYGGVLNEGLLLDDLTLDVGSIAYLNDVSDFNFHIDETETIEVYAGLAYDLDIAQAKGYAYYDYELKRFTAVGSLETEITLIEYFVLIRPSVDVGYLTQDTDFSNVDYFYATASADIVLYMEYIELLAGIQYNWIDSQSEFELSDLTYSIRGVVQF